jgi:D-glycero-D-manno-heptose 1,7-bisphosphate phosphatase
VSEAARAGSRACVFFDRDGTLNREVEGALSSPEQLELLPGAAKAVARVNLRGALAIVLSNQSAIARGWMNHFELERVHARFGELMQQAGARIDDVLICPHLDTAGLAPYHRRCACRKPKPGLFELAAARWNLDLANSWIVGDALRDLEAGAALGVRGILVRTGKGAREEQRLRELELPAPHFAVAATVLEAVELALAAPPGARGSG